MPLDFSRIEALSGAFCEARALHAAVALDLFSAVAAGASAAQVATARGLNPRATELLLNALAGLELLNKADGVFTLPEGARRHLLPDGPESLCGMIRLEAAWWEPWGRLEEAVRTGLPMVEPGGWQRSPEETRRFILAMDSLVRARGDAEHVADTLDFSGVRRLLDVGAGPGTYPMAVCRAHPHVAATILDLPATLAVTTQVLRERGMAERVATVAGDFNTDPLPGGFDMVFLSNVIHGEDEAHCRALVRKCLGALNPGGRIVIKDHILSADRTRPVGGAVFSLHMLLLTRGRDYSLDEVSGWLAEAGFEPPTVTVLPAPFSSSLVVARRPG
ncbi:MAG: methyltransferase domain-containing protein [Nitrospirae bacterium]|nr:methyltransferase domain-containing protein [Nitrospirota bacterium]